MIENLSATKGSSKESRRTAVWLCLIGILIIGDFDYLTGYKISLLVFYVLPVGFATIFVGPEFGLLLAILSVTISIGTDFWAGMPYSEVATVFWNAGIALLVFCIVIGFLHLFNNILLRLKASIENRTQELLNEMKERGRLEREIIDLSEKEQRHFGRELHDVVCQELTSASIAAHLLARKLLASSNSEAEHARELAQLVDHSLATTRSVARGSFAAGLDGAGLAEALRETARYIEGKNKISCAIRWQGNLAINKAEAVVHLFRIAQEAMSNVVKHAGASHMEVSVSAKDETLRLMIEDNGRGLSPSNKREGGLGLSIMSIAPG